MTAVAGVSLRIRGSDLTHQVTEYYAVPGSRQPNLALRAIRAVMRLILPVTALLAVLMWADFETGRPATFLDSWFPSSDLQPGSWLTMGHVLLGLMFFVLNLTNRRYGAAYAVAQVLIVWAVVAILAYLAFFDAGQPLPVQPLPPLRTGFAFVAALFAAQMINIAVFEGTRGRPWWRAPLYASLWGALMFAIVFYPAAYSGVDVAWIDRMMMHLGILVAMGIALLLPYYLLRPMINPLPGFGGA